MLGIFFLGRETQKKAFVDNFDFCVKHFQVDNLVKEVVQYFVLAFKCGEFYSVAALNQVLF